MNEDNNSDFFLRICNNINKISQMQESDIVSDGQISPSIASISDTMINKTTLSKNNEEAVIQEQFENSLLGKGIEVKNKDEIEKISHKYIEKIYNILLENN